VYSVFACAGCADRKRVSRISTSVGQPTRG
jgi:hypothetical protein